MRPKKKIPKFKNEDEERDFWATHCSVDYVDWSKAKKVALPKLTGRLSGIIKANKSIGKASYKKSLEKKYSR